MAAGLGFQLPDPKHYGVAMLFLPREEAVRRRSEQIVAEVVDEAGLKLLGWRDVPTENGCLGELARMAEPVMRQVFISGQGREDEELERRLYVVRKRIERRVAETLGEAADDFYVPSMSCRTIIYKGMFLRRNCSPIIRTCPTRGCARPWPSSTSGTAPTPFRVGGWPSRSA